MNKTLKGLAIAAAGMIAAGILLAGFGFMAGGNQPISLDSSGFHVGGDHADGRMETFKLKTESFHSIDADLDYYDIDLIPSDHFAVEGKFYAKDGQPEVQVKDGVLTVRNKDHMGVKINLDVPGLMTSDQRPFVKIYYPKETKFKTVSVTCDSSDLAYEDLAADEINLELDMGKLEASKMKADRITVSMDSGDCTLTEIDAADSLTVDNDMGKITLADAGTKKLNITANSGDVSLTDVTADFGELTLDMGKLTGNGLLTKGLIASSDSGDVNLQGELTGVTDITCDMGSVTVNPGGLKDKFSYELNADMGSISIGGAKVTGAYHAINENTENKIKISTDMGSIQVDFKE